MKMKAMVLSFVVLILFFIVFSPGVSGLRSEAALQIQTYFFREKSVFNQVGLDLDVPTGRDYSGSGWCRNIKLFHPGNNFPHNDGKGEMSILYNFGDFEKERSTFYDPNSDYFNAHYGVYAIRLEQGVWGWENGKLNVEALADIIAFDQLDLVMASLGCPPSDRSFEYQITEIKEGPEMAGFSDWIQMDGLIQTNSPLHQKTENRLGYIQYGEPPKHYKGEDFPAVSMLGRLYLRYDQRHDVTVIYFVIGKTREFIDQTSKNYLMPIQWNNIKVQE